MLDQFGSVIRERGREYRESEEGRQLKAGIDGVYRSLEEQERATLRVVLNSLDGFLATLTDLHRSFDADPVDNGSHNGSANGDGRAASGEASSTNGAQPHSSHDDAQPGST